MLALLASCGIGYYMVNNRFIYKKRVSSITPYDKNCSTTRLHSCALEFMETNIMDRLRYIPLHTAATTTRVECSGTLHFYK